MQYETLLQFSPYELTDEKKQPLFKAALIQSFQHHYDACALYRKLCDRQGFHISNNFNLADLPYLPVDIFKQLSLTSVAESDIVRVLKSSATSSQIPSSVSVDHITRNRQIKTLAWILRSYIGKDRSPFIIMDVDPNTLKGEQAISARTAAIRGFLTAASSADYCMSIDTEQKYHIDIEKFKALLLHYESSSKRLVLFGYTYMLYVHVAKQLKAAGLFFHLPNAIIFHIGGWKKLQSEAVSRNEFNSLMMEVFGIPERHIFDAYGFTEQLGLIYIDHGEELKRCPLTSEIIIRDPITLEPVADGKEGFIEFITPMPNSYPGIAILLEDIGVVVSREPSASGRHGTAFKVLGRAKQAEIRGCGDIMSEMVAP